MKGEDSSRDPHTSSTTARLLVAFLALTVTFPMGLGAGLASTGSSAGQASAPTSALDDPQSPEVGCTVPGVDDKCEDWTASEGFGEFIVSPDSQTLYNLRGAAFDAKTGEHLWSGEYDMEEVDGLAVMDVGLSPETNVLVTTARASASEGTFYHTTAWNATTGDRVWTTTLETEGGPIWLDVDPDGERVYVTGNGGTVAYDLDTGETDWEREFVAARVAAGPQGEDIYLARLNPDGGFTAASWNASEGHEQWLAHTSDQLLRPLSAVSLTPDGSTLTLAGGDFVAAFDTQQAEAAWEVYMHEQAGAWIEVSDSAMDPGGETLYVAGSTGGTDGYVPGPRDGGYVTALDVGSGQAEWVHHMPGRHTFNTLSDHLAISEDGSRVYVQSQWALPYGNMVATFDLTQFQAKVVTESLIADSGETVWRATYPSGESETLGPQSAGGVAVAPDGSYVYSNVYPVPGLSNPYPGETQGESRTLAYETGAPDAVPQVPS